MTDDQPKPNEKWLSSEEARKILRVSSCGLMHLREVGALRFKKQGNAFMYVAGDVKRKKEQPKRRRDM